MQWPSLRTALTAVSAAGCPLRIDINGPPDRTLLLTDGRGGQDPGDGFLSFLTRTLQW